MLKSLFGMAPIEEPDGSFRPSKLAMKLATSEVTDFEAVHSGTAPSERSKIMVLFTERKNMTMKNGRQFSTGNHPVEALVPMLHLKNAGFEFEIITPTGQPVVFEMWAMPTKDPAVMNLYQSLKTHLDEPKSLIEVVKALPDNPGSYAALFVPGGHGAMLGIPEDRNVGRILRWANAQDLFTISICHGPGGIAIHRIGRKRISICRVRNGGISRLDRQTDTLYWLFARPHALATVRKTRRIRRFDHQS